MIGLCRANCLWATSFFRRCIIPAEAHCQANRGINAVGFRLRLDKTAEIAKLYGFDYFVTTLSISPLKNAQLINRIGSEISEKYGVSYLPSDFKKREGYKRSIELSKKYGLYRQNFCGCVYSKIQADKNEPNFSD